jgi:hypothetical protein
VSDLVLRDLVGVSQGAKPGAVSDLGFFARNVPNQSGSSRASEIRYCGYVWARCGIAWILAIPGTAAAAQSLTCPVW